MRGVDPAGARDEVSARSLAIARMPKPTVKVRDDLGDATLRRWYDIWDECMELATSCRKSDEEFGAAALGAIAYRVEKEIQLRQHELAPEKFPHPKQRNTGGRKRRKQPTEP